MIGLIVQLAVSNVLVSAALAALAYAVHSRGRHPVLAHALWVIVLVKVVTPPLVILPLVTGPAPAVVEPVIPIVASMGASASAVGPVGPVGWTVPDAVMGMLVGDGAAPLLVVWALGSVLVLIASLLRVRRFDGLLRRTSTPAPPPIARVAASLAASLGLCSLPAIELSRARVSPMTWWMGGRVRIVIPDAMAARSHPEDLNWILAHELAHVRRRDHLVRWLEWLACVAFWWNPVVWWARRKLREAEEASCDALVLDRLAGPPRSYARALLSVVELLAHPAVPPLALATGIGAGEALERRFRAILSGRRQASVPGWVMASVLGSTVASLVVGVGMADGRVPTPASSARAFDGALVASDRQPVEPVEPVDAVGPQGDDGYTPVSGRLGSIAGTDAKPASSRRAHSPRRWDDVYVGTPGSDVYQGTRGRDRVDGRGGPDDLSGRHGRDLIRGGPDRDEIAAGRDDDVVISWRDGVSDVVDCGAGDADRAVVDASDIVADCEIVTVR